MAGGRRPQELRPSWPVGADGRILLPMAHPVPNPPPGFDALSVDEKVAYVESLWERVLEQSPSSIPEWQTELLRERLEAYRSDPVEGRPWGEVKAELESKYLAPR